MKNSFINLFGIITMICVILFAACKEVAVIGITLNKNELTLSLNETETLVVTVHPIDATNKKVTWTSSNTDVATVNENGVVIAIDNGTTIITATTQEGKKQATCLVTVDYRACWIGNWDFETDRTWSIGWDSGHTVTNYLGKINLVDRDSLLIEYMENSTSVMNKIITFKH